LREHFPEQKVLDRQFDFTADSYGKSREHVKRVGNPPVRRVLDWHKSELGLAAVHFFEDGGDIPDRRQFDRLSEMGNGGKMAVGVERPEEGDTKLTHERSASTDDLAQRSLDGLLGQGPSSARSGLVDPFGFFGEYQRRLPRSLSDSWRFTSVRAR
jgi:hypothetical protein